MSKLHTKIIEITDRIIDRSKSYRKSYLNTRMQIEISSSLSFDFNSINNKGRLWYGMEDSIFLDINNLCYIIKRRRL